MLLSGLLLLSFVIFHLAHFTWKLVKPEYMTYYDASSRPDVYHMVVTGFSVWYISAFYIVSMAVLVPTHFARVFERLPDLRRA